MNNADMPAMPIPEAKCRGLTKREMFAMAAMQGLLANPNVVGFNHNHGWGLVNCDEDQLSMVCIAQAESLLTQLSREPQA